MVHTGVWQDNFGEFAGKRFGKMAASDLFSAYLDVISKQGCALCVRRSPCANIQSSTQGCAMRVPAIRHHPQKSQPGQRLWTRRL